MNILAHLIGFRASNCRTPGCPPPDTPHPPPILSMAANMSSSLVAAERSEPRAATRMWLLPYPQSEEVYLLFLLRCFLKWLDIDGHPHFMPTTSGDNATY